MTATDARTPGTIRLANRRFALEMSTDGKLTSLRTPRSRDELLVPADRPAFTLHAGGRAIELGRCQFVKSRSRLIVATADDSVRVELDVHKRPTHLAFRPVSVNGVSGTVRLELVLQTPLAGGTGEYSAIVFGEHYSLGLQALRAYGDGGAEPSGGGATVRVDARFDADAPGGGIALFACRAKRTMETYLAIEQAEGLPRPQIDGVRSKHSRLIRESNLWGSLEPECAEQTFAWAKRMGLNQIYSYPLLSNPQMGHYQPNPQMFPGGMNEFVEYCRRVRSEGLEIGLHTMSAWITPTDPFVTPVPHKDLAWWAEGTLVEPVDAVTETIRVAGDADFAGREMPGPYFEAEVLRIGDELIEFEDVELHESGATYTGCTRGAFGTAASARDAGEPVRLMITHYGKKFSPEPDSELAEEMARLLADTLNRAGVIRMSFDGLETMGFRGAWGINRFVEDFYRHLDHYVIGEGSVLTHYVCHLFDSANWGEECVYLRDDLEKGLRVGRNIHRQRTNFLPAGLGAWPIRPGGPQWPATDADDWEYILAKCAGYDAELSIIGPIGWIDRNGQTGRIADLIRKWESLRHAGAFTARQRELLRTPGLDFRLDDSGQRPRVTAVKVSPRHFLQTPAPDQPLRVPVSNPYRRQRVRLKVRVLAAMDRDAEGAVPLIPGDGRVIRQGERSARFAYSYDAGEEPGIELNCRYADEAIETDDAGRALPSGPADCRWPVGPGGSMSLDDSDAMLVHALSAPKGEGLNLVDHRGLGMWLDVTDPSPGAMLVVQLIAVSGHRRQYYAPLDEPGRRWVQWPHGQMGVHLWHDYRWGPRTWFKCCKKFDYDKVAQVSLVMINLPPGGEASARVTGLTALKERPATLGELEVKAGGRRMRIAGPVHTGEYLVCEVGREAGVYDADWHELRKVRVTGSASVEPGDREIELRPRASGPRPWLEVETRLLGPSFTVRA